MGGGVSTSQSDFMFYKRLQHELLLLSKHSSAFQVLIDLHTTTQEYICSEWIIHYASKNSYHLLTPYYVPCPLYTHFHLFIKTWQKGLIFPILKWKSLRHFPTGVGRRGVQTLRLHLEIILLAIQMGTLLRTRLHWPPPSPAYHQHTERFPFYFWMGH